MSKPKGPTWEQARLSFNRVPGAREVERREIGPVLSYTSRMGRSTVTLRCPFCLNLVVAYPWSLSASGKRCECGAILGSRSFAFHWDDRGEAA